MKNIGLKDIVLQKQKDLLQQKKRLPFRELKKRLTKAAPVRDFAKALIQPGKVSLIAELKKASPSAGVIRQDYDVRRGALSYASAGANAVSVLTEANFFQGDLMHIHDIKETVHLPVLRKDFIFDPYQIYESRVYGADAVLLIVALLAGKKLMSLMNLAHQLGMTPLVEVHDAFELETAVRAGACVIGVNSRNLKTLSVDTRLFEQLIPQIPGKCVTVAESGIKTRYDVQRLKKLNVNAMLVGESLLKQPDLEKAVRVLSE